jgi:hypothetical protein
MIPFHMSQVLSKFENGLRSRRHVDEMNEANPNETLQRIKQILIVGE